MERRDGSDKVRQHINGQTTVSPRYNRPRYSAHSVITQSIIAPETFADGVKLLLHVHL